MNDRQSADELLARYLLGDALPEAEQAAIEERYFTDDLYFDHLLAIEDELIDRHLHGALSGSETAQFEKHFLASNRRREKWEAQRAIASFFRSRPAVAGWRAFLRSLSLQTRLVAGAALFAAALGMVLLSWAYWDLRGQNDRLQTRLAEIREQPLAAPEVAAFVLRAERLRASAGDQVEIKPNTRWVELRVEIPQFAMGSSTFAAVLSTADGQKLWEQSGLAKNGASVEIDSPASMLQNGDYVLTLTASSGHTRVNLPAYQFRVTR